MSIPRAPREEKRIPFPAKLLPWVKSALAIVAAENNRSQSNMVETMIVEWITQHRPDLLASDTEEPGPYRDELSGRK